MQLFLSIGISCYSFIKIDLYDFNLILLNLSRDYDIIFGLHMETGENPVRARRRKVQNWNSHPDAANQEIVIGEI